MGHTLKVRFGGRSYLKSDWSDCVEALLRQVGRQRYSHAQVTCNRFVTLSCFSFIPLCAPFPTHYEYWLVALASMIFTGQSIQALSIGS